MSSEAQSFVDSYKVLKISSSSTAADAVQKLGQRFATGSDELAAAVRKDQDLKEAAKAIFKG